MPDLKIGDEIRQQRTVVENLRLEIEMKQKSLVNAEQHLERMENKCYHQWSGPIADHIYHKGYTIPGDEPGTCGSDWRGKVEVNPRTEERWKRICKVCGKTETTTQTRAIQEPFFRD